MHTRNISRLLAAALPAAVVAVALPTAAQAGTAFSLPDGLLVYSDSTLAGESNNASLRFAGGRILIADTAPTGSATSQCKVVSGGLDCASHAQVRVILGAKDDVVEYRLPQAGIVQTGDGNDVVHAGIRDGSGQVIQPVTYLGEGGFDVIGYDKASSGVVVDMADGVANDGRPGERENIAAGFEHLNGSSFRDTLFGTPGPDGIAGGLERDIIAGGGGNDAFYSTVKDGADDYHGGPGVDTIEYFGRTQPLKVTLDNVANDGETDGRFSVEGDNVNSNVENVNGGSGADTLSSLSAFSRLEGRGGADTLSGGDGPDTLIGGAGRDSLDAGGGNDVADVRDGEPDFVDCGAQFDTVSRDSAEGIFRGCETQTVGVLRLAAKAIDARAGKAAPVSLSWRHPDGWRKLRTVTLRLMRDGAAVGAVTIRPGGERIEADGLVKVARRATRLTREGKSVRARLALRIADSMAGQKLALEVEATDTQGRRQLERGAGAIRVAE